MVNWFLHNIWFPFCAFIVTTYTIARYGIEGADRLAGEELKRLDKEMEEALKERGRLLNELNNRSVILMTILHPGLEEPIRVTNAITDLGFNYEGNNYISCPLELILPNNEE